MYFFSLSSFHNNPKLKGHVYDNIVYIGELLSKFLLWTKPAFTQAIFAVIFLLLMHAIKWIDLHWPLDLVTLAANETTYDVNMFN